MVTEKEQREPAEGWLIFDILYSLCWKTMLEITTIHVYIEVSRSASSIMAIHSIPVKASAPATRSVL